MNKITIKDEVMELVLRNKGNIQDTIEIVNQMILIYSILNVINKEYQQITIDLQILKTQLQIEKMNFDLT